MISRLKSFKSNKGFMKYFRNTSWLFAEKILRMVVGLLIGVWVARYLGPEEFGLFSYANSFVGLFVVFATLGLDGIVIRELVTDESRRDVLLGTAFWLKILGAFGVLLFLSIAIHFTSNNIYTNTLIFIIASSTIFQSFNVIDLFFQAKVLSRYIVYANSVVLFISSMIRIVLLLYEAPLIAFVWVGVFSSFILAIGYLYVYIYNNLSLKSWRFETSVAISLLKDSWLLILSGLVISIYLKIDQVMIQEMLGSQSVGLYSAAVKLSEVWYYIPIVISSSLFPAIINAKKHSEKLYYERLQKLFDLMVWMSIAIALPMTFLSDFVVEFLYGEQYHQSGDVLMIHIWAGVFVFLGVVSGKWLLIENLQIISFWRTFSGMMVNIILNLLLIPKFGINGAAVATILANFMAAFLFDLFNNKTREIFYMKIKALYIVSTWRRNV